MRILPKLMFGAALLCSASATWAQSVKVVLFDVDGMSCQFCIFGLKKNLSNLPNVMLAEISMKKMKARVTYQPGADVNSDLLHTTAREAGYQFKNMQVKEGSK